MPQDSGFLAINLLYQPVAYYPTLCDEVSLIALSRVAQIETSIKLRTSYNLIEPDGTCEWSSQNHDSYLASLCTAKKSKLLLDLKPDAFTTSEGRRRLGFIFSGTRNA